MSDRRHLVQDTIDDVGVGARAAPNERRRPRTVANRAFGALKAQHPSERTVVEAFADRLNNVASSGPFLILHLFWFAGWIIGNAGVLGNAPWDPYPFGFLTLVVSLEAIFLSIFVLFAQKRESAIAELREELALQVNMRMEEEVTKTLQLVAGLYTRLGHVMGEDEELGDMLQPLDVSRIEADLLEEIRVATAPRGPRWRLPIALPWRRTTDGGNLPDPHDQTL